MAGKHFIGFYITPNQAKTLKRAAKKEHRNLSSYIRHKLFFRGGSPPEGSARQESEVAHG